MGRKKGQRSKVGCYRAPLHGDKPGISAEYGRWEVKFPAQHALTCAIWRRGRCTCKRGTETTDDG